MSIINDLVFTVISEEMGHAGCEMYNDGPKGQGSVTAKYFAEPGLKQPVKEGQKIVGQGGPDTSSFAKESILPGLKDAASSNPLDGSTPSVNKFGGGYDYSKKEEIAYKLSGDPSKANSLSGTNQKIVKSPNVT